MNSVRELFGSLSLGKQLLASKNLLPIASFERSYKYQKHEIPTPKPGGGRQFRRYVFICRCIGYVTCFTFKILFVNFQKGSLS